MVWYLGILAFTCVIVPQAKERACGDICMFYLHHNCLPTTYFVAVKGLKCGPGCEEKKGKEINIH